MVFNSNGNNRLNMKKITLLLLLTLSVLGLQAQTTYQLNYDSIRVNKTAGTGGTSLYGKVYLKNVGLGLVSDSILTVRNGRIFKIPHTTALTTTTISNVANANGVSITGDQIRLHRVSDTTGGVLTAGIDTIGGDKYFADQIWITENQQFGGHIGIVSASGSLMAPLLGASSESSSNWLEILAHPAPNLYGTKPTDGIKFQVFNEEGPNPITTGNAYNFKNGSTSLFNIGHSGDSNIWGGLSLFDNAASNGAISLGSGSGALLAPIFGASSESSTAWLNFTGQPATNIDNTNPTDAFKFNAYKSSDGSQALTGGNLVNFFNKNVSKFSVDYTGVITSAGLTNGLVKSVSGALSNATSGTDYTLLNGTGIVEMAGTTASYLSSTGSGNVVKETSPTLTTPNIGNATGGTLSLSGKLTSTLGNNTEIFTSASATTGYQFGRMTNTSGGLLWGIEGSAAGTLLTGGSAYGGVLTTGTSTNLEFGTNQVKAITIDGTTQDVTIANNITADNLLSGTYTTTLTNGTNVSSSSVNGDFHYIRVGNQVTVEGSVTINFSGAGNTVFDISIPVASNFTNFYQLNGSGINNAPSIAGSAICRADTTNDRMSMNFEALSANGLEYVIRFTYTIL